MYCMGNMEFNMIEKGIYWLYWRIHQICSVEEFRNKSFKEFLEE